MRDGVSTETNLLDKWPADGPPLAWTVKGLGRGLAAIITLKGRFYVVGDHDRRAHLQCYDLATRKQIWSCKIGKAWSGVMGHPPTASGKILVLAVGKTDVGKLFIVPIDIEHEADDQSPLTPEQERAFQDSKNYLFEHLPELDAALGHLHGIFAGRLQRGAFRTFENFCFALLGMARIPEEKQQQAREEASRLEKHRPAQTNNPA